MKDLSNENVIHIRSGEIQYLQFRKLLKYENEINHAYSLGTNMNFRTSNVDKEKFTSEQKEIMLDSYRDLCKNIHCDYTNVVKPNQNHTDCVKKVEEKINKNEPDFNLTQYNETDGLITNQKDVILATTNADCILLLFYDPINKVIANVHSGWKGTLQRISVKTVKKMQEEFNCKPENIICCICPSIRKCHFEVEKDVKDMFEEQFKDIVIKDSSIIEEKIQGEKWNIDTVKINQIMLESLGLKKENIVDSGICSVCNSDLIHSYRVEKQGYGLSVALIGL